MFLFLFPILLFFEICPFGSKDKASFSLAYCLFFLPVFDTQIGSFVSFLWAL